MDNLFKSLTVLGVVLGIGAIILGVLSGQNIKNELNDSRLQMIINSQRSDLLSKIIHIDTFLNKYLVKVGCRYDLIKEKDSYEVTDKGHDLLTTLEVFNYLESIYYDQPNIPTQDLVVHILSENTLPKRIACFNDKKEKKGEKIIPLEAILATIIIHHQNHALGSE